MGAETVPYGRVTQKAPPVSDVHIVWITAGLGCDGDSVAVTNATQPSIEDVLLGAIPGLPRVHLHNPVLAYENGDEFMEYWYRAERGELDPFVLVVEGSIPNEKIKSEGYWAALGTDKTTGQPITTNEWIDRLAPRALVVVAIGTCATYGGIHAIEGNPTGAMGLADYLGWDFKTPAGIPIVNVPGCPVHPDNFMETVLYLLYQASGLAPMIPLDGVGRPLWLLEVLCTKAATGPVITSRATLRLNMAPRSASSNSVVGDRWSTATYRSAAGPVVSAVVPTWEASVSGAPCRAFRTSSCRSWTNRRVASFPPPQSAFMARPLLRCVT